MKCYIITFALLTCSALICSGQETIAETDSVKITQDSTSLSRHDLDEAILKNVYSELLDVDKQIRLTHNMLVDLNFMSPGVERKIQMKLDELNGRLDKASAELDSITDKSMKTKAKPYKVTLKDCRQKLSKCSGMLKKKTKR
jgi:paraquat-inducible protein B